MSYVFHILFALGTLLLPELGWTGGRELPWLVPLLACVPHVLAWFTRRVLMAGRFRVGGALERLLGVSPVLLQALALGQLGWLATLERFGLHAPAFDEWLGLDLLGALVPYFVYQLATIDARARFLVFPPDTPAKLRVFQVRMFLAALLPFLAYLAGSSLIARSEVWRVRLETIGLLGGLAAVGLVGAFLYGMPFFLRYVWDTAPLERGWARRMLEDVADAAGFRYRELLVWRTGHQMANAAIVGFSARSRMVLFSDLLLQQLGPRELAAVFAHEMGHARRAHAAVFGAFALGFFLSAQGILTRFELETSLWGGAVLLAIIGLWYLAFGYLSRRFELEADLESLRAVGESGPLIRALELVTGAHAHERSSWRHFSTRDRVAFLQATERDPLVGIRLKLRLSRWRKVGFALLAVAGALKLQELTRDWDEDWVRADLRLGRFEAAAERAEEPGVDPELAALAQRGVRAPARSRDARALLSAALDARKRGDLAAAREWIELAHLRGAEDVDPLLEALAGPPGTLRDMLEAWRRTGEELSER